MWGCRAVTVRVKELSAVPPLSVCQTRARGTMGWPDRSKLQFVCDLYYWAASQREPTSQPPNHADQRSKNVTRRDRQHASFLWTRKQRAGLPDVGSAHPRDCLFGSEHRLFDQIESQIISRRAI